MCTDTSGKEGLPETSRPGLIPAMWPDHSEESQWFAPQDPLCDIHCLRLKGTHLDTEGGVLDGGHYALFRVKATPFSAVRDRKCPLEVFKRKPPGDDLLCDGRVCLLLIDKAKAKEKTYM